MGWPISYRSNLFPIQSLTDSTYWFYLPSYILLFFFTFPKGTLLLRTVLVLSSSSSCCMCSSSCSTTTSSSASSKSHHHHHHPLCAMIRSFYMTSCKQVHLEELMEWLFSHVAHSWCILPNQHIHSRKDDGTSGLHLQHWYNRMLSSCTLHWWPNKHVCEEAMNGAKLFVEGGGVVGPHIFIRSDSAGQGGRSN